MYLKAQPISDSSLNECGRVLTPLGGPAPAEGEIFSWKTIESNLGMPDGGLLAGRFECRARPIQTSRFECHHKTTELISAVTGDAIIFLAPPQNPDAGSAGEKDRYLRGLRAIILPRGHAILLDRGAWHAIPFPVGRENVTLLVVFRDKTGEDDLHFFEMSEQAELAH